MRKLGSLPWLKWLALFILSCIDGYLVVLMYAQGEYLFALLTLVVLTLGIYLFSQPKTYSWRYIYPGIAGMIIFVLFPLAATIAIAFTNYSGTNQLSYERALNVLLQQYYFAGEKYDFKLYAKGDQQWQLVIQGQQQYISPPFDFQGESTLLMSQIEKLPDHAPENLRTITQNRQALQQLQLRLPTGQVLSMSSLRQFSQRYLRYRYDEQQQLLINNQTQQAYKANNEIGFFQAVDQEGQYQAEKLEPGYTVAIGWQNFMRIFTDPGIQKPFVQIFLWTVAFALFTVIFTVFLGMILACLVQWDALKGKGIYRLLLILPYAVPAFISIFIFKGLFNQSFGEINLILNQLFGIRPEWFNSPFLAKIMLLIVNTWLGYPYMMILCMGLLKAIPNELYEASAMDGASSWQNFSKITMPMLLKPLTPLMIASFAFNFNNFVLIQLLTNGGPDMVGTTTPAGNTDLLVNYTYRIAFEGSGSQDFGLAAAIATLIFLLVAGLAWLNLKATKFKLD